MAASATPELMRLIAHELRQPLSTIESIAYYLSLILPEDPKTREQLDRIQQLVEQSNWMLTSSQLISDPLPAAHELVDLSQLVALMDLERVDVSIADPLPLLSADGAVLRAMLENLLLLFRQLAARTSLKIAKAENGVLIELHCATATQRSENSLGPGSGLSIRGARRVAESFGGSLDLSIDPASIRLRVLFPA